MRIKALEYFVTKEQIIGFTVESCGENKAKVRVPASLSIKPKELEQFSQNFIRAANGTLGENPDDDDLTMPSWRLFCDEWGKKLLEPIYDQIDETDILYIVPHGILNRLPFHAIRFDDDYLCKKLKVCYVPNTAVLRRCRNQNKARRIGASYRPEKCLSIGCNMDSGDTRKREEFCTFAREIAEHFKYCNRNVLTEYCSPLPAEKVANFENLKSTCEKEEIDLLSFFCHGSFDENEPLLSALHIPPKNISSLDLMSNFHTTANLVTLIACTSADPYIGQGGAVHSLATALIFCGAATVTGALWKAYTPSARVFFRKFISSWCSGTQKAMAFQEAQTELMKTKEFSHPYHWGPYILIGDWY